MVKVLNSIRNNSDAISTVLINVIDGASLFFNTFITRDEKKYDINCAVDLLEYDVNSFEDLVARCNGSLTPTTSLIYIEYVGMQATNGILPVEMDMTFNVYVITISNIYNEDGEDKALSSFAKNALFQNKFIDYLYSDKLDYELRAFRTFNNNSKKWDDKLYGTMFKMTFTIKVNLGRLAMTQIRAGVGKDTDIHQVVGDDKHNVLSLVGEND